MILSCPQTGHVTVLIFLLTIVLFPIARLLWLELMSTNAFYITEQQL